MTEALSFAAALSFATDALVFHGASITGAVICHFKLPNRPVLSLLCAAAFGFVCSVPPDVLDGAPIGEAAILSLKAAFGAVLWWILIFGARKVAHVVLARVRPPGTPQV